MTLHGESQIFSSFVSKECISVEWNMLLKALNILRLRLRKRDGHLMDLRQSCLRSKNFHSWKKFLFVWLTFRVQWVKIWSEIKQRKAKKIHWGNLAFERWAYTGTYTTVTTFQLFYLVCTQAIQEKVLGPHKYFFFLGWLKHSFFLGLTCLKIISKGPISVNLETPEKSWKVSTTAIITALVPNF